MASEARKSVGGRAPRLRQPVRIALGDFLDHDGQHAVCAMYTARPKGLPIPRHPLSFQVYMVNGLTYSPNAAAEPLPQASDDAVTTMQEVDTISDEETAKSRQFIKAFMNSIGLDGGGYLRHFSLAVYFMPKGSSPEDCMEHYQREREYRAPTVWPMPETYAVTRHYISYRDLLLRFQPREDSSLVFGPGHPVQFVVYGPTKIIPEDLLNWYSDDEHPFIQEEMAFMGSKGRTHLTVKGDNESPSTAEYIIDEYIRSNLAWRDEDRIEWDEAETECLNELLRNRKPSE